MAQTTPDSDSHGHADGHSGIGHVVSPKILVATAAGLLVLTVVTVMAAKVDFAQLDLPELNIFFALAIAVMKATLVCLFFMHLRWDRPFNAFVLVSSLALVALFIVFAMTDTSEYEHEKIHGDSAIIQAELDRLPAPDSPTTSRVDGRGVPLTLRGIVRDPFRNQQTRFLAGALWMRLFLISLAMLFGAGLLAFVAIRIQLDQKNLWPALPPLPNLLLLSTFLLAISSACLQWGLNGIRVGKPDQLRNGLLLTLLLGLAFLLVQARCWLIWLAPISQRWSQSDEFRFALTSFYVLTGIHALHVAGGIATLVVVVRHAARDMYSAEDHSGVHYAMMYWHFLGVVWLILYVTMWLGI